MVSWLTDLSHLKSSHTIVSVGLVRLHMFEGGNECEGTGWDYPFSSCADLDQLQPARRDLTHATSPSSLQSLQATCTGPWELMGKCT